MDKLHELNTNLRNGFCVVIGLIGPIYQVGLFARCCIYQVVNHEQIVNVNPVSKLVYFLKANNV